MDGGRGGRGFFFGGRRRRRRSRRRRREGSFGRADGFEPARAYGACQETHVLHYLERLFCTHVDALDESALASVAAECGLFQSLCAFLDERGASLVAEDRRAGLYALSGIIATESFASHRRFIVGGAAGDGAVTVGNASPMSAGGSRGGRTLRANRKPSRIGSPVQSSDETVQSSDETVRLADETARRGRRRTTKSPRWTPESFESPLGSWNPTGVGKTWTRRSEGASSRCSTRRGGFGGTARSGVRIPAGPRPTGLGVGSADLGGERRANARRPMSGRVIADRIRALSAV